MVANMRIREAQNDGGREGQTEEKDRKFGKHRLPGVASSEGEVKEIVSNNRWTKER